MKNSAAALIIVRTICKTNTRVPEVWTLETPSLPTLLCPSLVQMDRSEPSKLRPQAVFPHTHLHRYALPTRVLDAEGIPHAHFGRSAGPGAGNGGTEAQRAK